MHDPSASQRRICLHFVRVSLGVRQHAGAGKQAARRDPFMILYVDHDPYLRWWRVWWPYRAWLRRVYRMQRDEYGPAAETQRVRVAYRAVRTAVPPLPPYGPLDERPGLDLMEACDRRALAPEAAALRPRHHRAQSLLARRAAT